MHSTGKLFMIETELCHVQYSYGWSESPEEEDDTSHHGSQRSSSVPREAQSS